MADHDIQMHQVNLSGQFNLLPDGAIFVLKTPVRFEVRNGQLVNIDALEFECESLPGDSEQANHGDSRTET